MNRVKSIRSKLGLLLAAFGMVLTGESAIDQLVID